MVNIRGESLQYHCRPLPLCCGSYLWRACSHRFLCEALAFSRLVSNRTRRRGPSYLARGSVGRSLDSWTMRNARPPLYRYGGSTLGIWVCISWWRCLHHLASWWQLWLSVCGSLNHLACAKPYDSSRLLSANVWLGLKSSCSSWLPHQFEIRTPPESHRCLQ